MANESTIELSEGQTEKPAKKKSKLKIVLLILVLLVVVIAAATLQFTSVGYRITVPLRNFEEVSPNIYIHREFEADSDEVLKIINEARDRVNKFFGELRGTPKIIICDDEDTIAKLGGDHDTSTMVLFKAYCYISISSEFLNVDVLAHEITHAELHTRIYEGKVGTGAIVPTWFDEGVALQNDNRERYSEKAWSKATENGKNLVELNDIDTADEFYAGNVEERRHRYIISKHELGVWIDDNGVDSLIDLLDRINNGNSFNELYFES